MIMGIKTLMVHEDMKLKTSMVYENEDMRKEYNNNSSPVSISSLEVPEFLVRVRQEIISDFWSCYKNRSGTGWKKFVLVYHEACICSSIWKLYI